MAQHALPSQPLDEETEQGPSSDPTKQPHIFVKYMQRTFFCTMPISLKKHGHKPGATAK